MARCIRRASESSIYHVINRGAGKQIIFEDDCDRAYFMSKLEEMLERFHGTLLAWCLMDNHVHLLMRVSLSDLACLMHDLQGAYAGYFNRAHGHTGPLFEGRYKSEPVEDDKYLMTVVRYIHANPKNAGLARGMPFRWSSFNEYVGKPRYVDTRLVLGVFGGKAEFAVFHNEPCDDEDVLEPSDQEPHVDSDRAYEIAKRVCGSVDIRYLKACSRDERDRLLAQLKQRGLSVRQIQRITGISISTISRAGR